MKYSIMVFFLSMATISTTFGQNTDEFFTKADAFFKTNVTDGRVNYSAVKENISDLDNLLEAAKKINVTEANANEYQAFWINSYNLLVIKGIVENYPLKSPLDVGGFFDNKKYEIGGNKTTLNDIENKLLRAKFPAEARFHFVLVCGGLGCPPIINKAYKPETLDAQLEKQTKLALNDPQFIQLNKNRVKISQIFEWYKGDFTQNGQSLVGFINKYKSEPLPEGAKVSYYPYDWTLNEIK
ncbi:DUF547 domain-containing protein [Zobellia amurskyensis]|uniref:DUF547 domain-containing protein n=1 Tax=Zobellia amurskyensis TaxID=248905 RepID=A0A7X3D0R4_9FLAO|nr:DUF547 domain-containing protein [Zobellia amurskyensis]MUH34895.1 DUF547 domain-containing protein [Zobellia amurskyensis]